VEQPAIVCQECTVADDVPSRAEDCTFSVVVRQWLGDRDCTAQYNCCLPATTDCRHFCRFLLFLFCLILYGALQCLWHDSVTFISTLLLTYLSSPKFIMVQLHLGSKVYDGGTSSHLANDSIYIHAVLLWLYNATCFDCATETIKTASNLRECKLILNTERNTETTQRQTGLEEKVNRDVPLTGQCPTLTGQSFPNSSYLWRHCMRLQMCFPWERTTVCIATADNFVSNHATRDQLKTHWPSRWRTLIVPRDQRQTSHH